VITLAERHHLDSCLALIYLDMGKEWILLGHKSEAMTSLSKAYTLREAQRDHEGMAEALAGIGDLYGGPEANAEDLTKAGDYFKRALALIDPNVYRRNASSYYLGLGKTYYYQRRFAEARRFWEMALNISRKTQAPADTAIIEFHLAQLATDEQRFAEALSRLDNALPELSSLVDTDFVVGAYLARAEVLVQLGRKKEALQSLSVSREALPRMVYAHRPRLYATYYSRTAKLYAQLGEFQEAYRQMETLRESDRRLADAANTKQADELKMRFDVKLKEAESAVSQAEQKEAASRRLALALALALGLVLLGGFAFYLRKQALLAKTEASHHRLLAAAEASRAEVLAAASQAKTAFVANMSHELRSPLNAMLGFTRLLMRDERLPPDLRDDLSIVRISGEHLYTLINQVLDLSKIEAGRITLNEINFDLYLLLDELVGMFTISAKQKGLMLNVETDFKTPQFVSTDSIKLRQVLINLMSNAFKFTSTGGVTLQIGVERASEAEPTCVLSFAVIDTGIGIAPDDLSRLGEAFVQAHAGLQAKEGTGLGLALSRSFVKLMGGELKISSQVQQGTTVAFDIPVRVVESQSVAAEVGNASRKVIGLVPGQAKYRVLAVDDLMEGRKLLKRLFAPLGFEVREAANGQEALAAWEEWQPHLIFMDMRMPVMDGREATRRIRASEKGKSTVIIALTASSFEEERDDILAVGCNDFQRKPFREDALFEMMHKYLGVNFLYEEEMEGPVIPSGEKLAQLPDEMQAELMDALTNLDMEAIDAVIERIRTSDADSAQLLATLAKRFQYNQMRTLLLTENNKSVP
jgi:signal transduction histidine kinase/response regulator of citrate/malate metabolism